MTLGQTIKRLRKERRISMRDFHERLGIKLTHLAKIEGGHIMPSEDIVLRIASALGIEIRIYYRFIAKQDCVCTELARGSDYAFIESELAKRVPTKEFRRALYHPDKDEVEIFTTSDSVTYLIRKVYGGLEG